MLKLYQNKKWLYNKYWIEELPTHQIGKLCGVHRETIRKWLKKFNIHIRSYSEAHLLRHKKDQRNKKYRNKEWLEKKYLVERLDPNEIAKLCEVYPDTIRKWLRKFNIPRRSPGRSDIKTDKLVELLKEGKIIKEIAKICKCSESCVQRRLKKQNLNITRMCQYCGKEFLIGLRHSKIYCSDRCRDRAGAGVWAKRHPLKYKIIATQVKIRRNKRVIQKLGGKCARCGKTDWRILQINHINGNGRKERARLGKKIYTNILKGKDMDKYNLLCANCNILYEYDRGKRRDERWIEKNLKVLEDKR